MPGTNATVLSEAMLKNKSNAQLTRDLENANEVVASIHKMKRDQHELSESPAEEKREHEMGLERAGE